MIVLILSIATLGIVSYWNGYQLLLNNEIENRARDLEEALVHMDNIHRQQKQKGLGMDTAREEIKKFYTQMNREGFFILEDDKVLFNNFDEDIEWNGIQKAITDSMEKDIIHLGKNIFVYRIYEEWDLIIGFGMEKAMFSHEVLEAQKYVILLSIVALMFSMQAAIFIAHNISKPIKLLADLCDKIGMGSLQEKIIIKRNDEIGMLAKAFNNMIHKLQMNTSKLVEMTKLNENILRNISTGIITTDKDGNIVSLNPAAKELLGNIENKEAHGLHLKKTLQGQIYNTLSSGEGISHIHILEDGGEGERIYIDVMTSLLKGEEGVVGGAICSFRDITERKRIENNMETLNRLTSMGQLAAGMAHEIRNPLTGMKICIQVLQKRLLGGNEDGNNKLFEGVLYEIDRINHLITDLLNFAKPKKPHYEIVNIKNILERALELTNKGESNKNIHIEVVDYEEELLVFVDDGQVEQIFLNIIKNAINAMSHNGILEIILDKYEESNKEFATIKFKDNGCGIPFEAIEKIFDPFYTTDPQGTGLGLSVVYELVKENKGAIQVTSRIDIGTEFKVTFPLRGGKKSEKENIDS